MRTSNLRSMSSFAVFCSFMLFFFHLLSFCLGVISWSRKYFVNRLIHFWSGGPNFCADCSALGVNPIAGGATLRCPNPTANSVSV